MTLEKHRYQPPPDATSDVSQPSRLLSGPDWRTPGLGDREEAAEDRVRRLIMDTSDPQLAREEIVAGVVSTMDLVTRGYPGVTKLLLARSPADGKIFVTAVVRKKQPDIQRGVQNQF